MWPEIERYLPEYESAVLSAFDEQGLPSSVRCRAQLNGTEDLTLSPGEGIVFQPGPACLLFHQHDDRLWNLKSFVLRGTLSATESGWRFRPRRFIPGMGIGGLRSYWRLLVNGRKRTVRYLKRRGLKRPQIPWDEFQEMFSG